MSSDNQNRRTKVGQSASGHSHGEIQIDVKARIEMENIRKNICKAAAKGDIEFLKSHPDTDTFESREAKNSILHLFIIAQSVPKPESSGKNTIKKMLCKKFDQENAMAIVNDILENWPCLLRKPNKARDSPLHVAARYGLCSIAEALFNRAVGVLDDVERGEEAVRLMLREINVDGETAVHQAVRYQHSKMVKLLMSKDKNGEVEYGANINGETPLYMAAERGSNKLMKYILNKYNPPAYQGPNGRTALHAAALHSSKPDDWLCIVEKEGLEFLATKVDDRGRTPLHYVPSMIKCDLYDPSAAFVVDKDGMTALHIAARKEYNGLIGNFLERCPECFEVDGNGGRNVLHYAVESGNKDAVDVIRKSEYLSDLLIKKDGNGKTPLHLLTTRMPEFINDHRIDKMAFDTNHFNPRDIANSIDVEINKLSLENSMKKCGIDLGKRVEFSCLESDDEENNKSDEGDDNMTEVRQNHLVVVALIATVTFGAGFTLPGGYIQQDGPNLGHAVLTENFAFGLFIVADSYAMVLSCIAVFIHLLIAMQKEKIRVMNQKMKKMKNLDKDREMVDMVQKINKRKERVSTLFSISLKLTFLAIMAMVFAFVLGLVAVLEHSRVAILNGCFFFHVTCFLWATQYKNSYRLMVSNAITVTMFAVADPRIVKWGVKIFFPKFFSSQIQET